MADIDHNLDSMLERSSGTDVPLLLKAKEDAKRRVKDDPSAANLAALARATQMLGAAMGKQSQILSGVKDVLAYLQGQGRKISQSQLYKDLKRGHLRREPDGSFSQRSVDRYAQTLTLISLPEAKTDGVADLAEEELKEKIAKTREQRLSIAFDRAVKEGRYIPREEVALELSSRAMTLGVGLRSVFRLYAPDWIRLVGGDPGKAEELATEFEKNLDEALNQYSRPMEFSVNYVPASTPEPPVSPAEESAKDEDS